MKSLTRWLVAPVVAGLLLPTAPASAAPPGCGGLWTVSATCVFTPPLAGLPIAFQGTAVGGGSTAATRVVVIVSVTVRGSTFVLGTCVGTGPMVAACSGQTTTPFPGFDHDCTVHGNVNGSYACVTDP